MNNIQQLRVQLEVMFNCMGGNNLELDTENILKDLQAKLNLYLNSLAEQFAESLEHRIKDSVREVGNSLLVIKDLESINKKSQLDTVSLEADEVLRPLMDLLDSSLSYYAEICEKTVLKRVLKELWRIVINVLEKEIILPQMSDKNVSFFTFF